MDDVRHPDALEMGYHPESGFRLGEDRPAPDDRHLGAVHPGLGGHHLGVEQDAPSRHRWRMGCSRLVVHERLALDLASPSDVASQTAPRSALAQASVQQALEHLASVRPASLPQQQELGLGTEASSQLLAALRRPQESA